MKHDPPFDDVSETDLAPHEALREALIACMERVGAIVGEHDHDEQVGLCLAMFAGACLTVMHEDKLRANVELVIDEARKSADAGPGAREAGVAAFDRLAVRNVGGDRRPS